MNKKTKIVATISSLNCSPEFIGSLFDAGMNVARINTAHVDIENADILVDNIRRVSDKIAIMVDTKGPEIRITSMRDEFKDGIAVEKGQVLNVRGTAGDTPSTPASIYTNHPDMYDDIPVGAHILIDDGDIELLVVGKEDGALQSEVRNRGIIRQRKSVNVPGVRINLESVTERDRMFIEWAVDRDLDFVAHSFVRSRDDVRQVKDIIEARGSLIKVISKIENREGVDNIDEILLETYGVMVARGDLGVEVAAEELPVMQKLLVKRCIESKRPVIIATQMLHSMMENPRPTRAEVSDVANAVYQRTDAIMLSGETASGLYPVESVETMSRIALEIERDNNNNAPFIDMNMLRIDNEITAQLARSTVRATVNLPIKAIVIDTMSGRTGRYLSAFRGQKPVYAMCYRKSVMRQLALSFGIEPMYCEPSPNHNSFLKKALGTLERVSDLVDDDLIAVMGGDFGVAVGPSFLEIAKVAQLKNKAEGYQVVQTDQK